MRLYLAPMAGYTDRPFRDICRENGADVVFTEMANCHLFSILPEKAMELLSIEGEKPPVAVQLFGSDPGLLGSAAAYLESRGVEYIDLNAGCPVRKVVKTGGGSALLKDPELLRRILSSMRAAVKKSRFSVKIRSGWDERNLNYLEIGRMAEGEGVDHITLHARTRTQGFTGKAAWEHIGELNAALKIPVVGNGDVKTMKDAADMAAATGVDEIMIGRGALSRPQIFREIKEEREMPLSREEASGIIMRLYRERTECHGERRGVVEMRKMVPFLVKGWRDAKQVRMAANRADSMAQVREIFI